MCEYSNIGGFEFIKLEQGAWRGFLAKDCRDAFGDINAWLELPDKKIILQTDCRTVARHPWNINGNSAFVYSKLMRAQNDGALKKHELFSLLKWSLGPSRSVAILKNTAKMLALGHLCPKPLLGVRKKMPGGHHLNLIVTAEITAPTIESVILEAPEEQVLVAVTAAGRDLALLHKDHFLHGDYLPRNTCLDNGRTVFLDNDKTAHWPFMPPFSQRRRNLEQFAYNLMLLRGLDECHLELPLAFIAAYFKESPRSDADRQKDIILKKTRARWENRRQRTIARSQADNVGLH